ncbi:unnamed protein product [Pedinophyceae sp. YPF-701]|nr:unnamed protein product [Pedinophyceae sp. YPF-701]
MSAAQQEPKPVGTVLTNPRQGVKNNGLDNEQADLIITVGDVFVSSSSGNRYVVADMLGSGTFGQVAKCTCAETGRAHAVKVIKNLPAYYHQARVEIGVLQLLNQRFDPHDRHNLVRMEEFFVHERHLCIVFELLSLNLYELIRHNQFRGLSINLLRVFLRQVLDALSVIREARIIHCDLKPENILLRSLDSGSIKLIDFGSACFENRTVYSYIQSRFYRSPEVVLRHRYTAAIDVWSLGCVAAELFLGLPLFPGASEHDLMVRIVEMLGCPPDAMLRQAKATSKFFKRAVPTSHSDPAPAWVLLTREESELAQGQACPAGKRYFKHRYLKDIIASYPYKSSLTQEEVARERQQREAFHDLLLGLLQLDPAKRWTPWQALQHPFVHAQPLPAGGRWTPPPDPAVAAAAAQNPVPERAPADPRSAVAMAPAAGSSVPTSSAAAAMSWPGPMAAGLLAGEAQQVAASQAAAQAQPAAQQPAPQAQQQQQQPSQVVHGFDTRVPATAPVPMPAQAQTAMPPGINRVATGDLAFSLPAGQGMHQQLMATHGPVTAPMGIQAQQPPGLMAAAVSAPMPGTSVGTQQALHASAFGALSSTPSHPQHIASPINAAGAAAMAAVAAGGTNLLHSRTISGVADAVNQGHPTIGSYQQAAMAAAASAGFAAATGLQTTQGFPVVSAPNASLYVAMSRGQPIDAAEAASAWAATNGGAGARGAEPVRASSVSNREQQPRTSMDITPRPEDQVGSPGDWNPLWSEDQLLEDASSQRSVSRGSSMQGASGAAHGGSPTGAGVAQASPPEGAGGGGPSRLARVSGRPTVRSRDSPLPNIEETAMEGEAGAARGEAPGTYEYPRHIDQAQQRRTGGDDDAMDEDGK